MSQLIQPFEFDQAAYFRNVAQLTNELSVRLKQALTHVEDLDDLNLYYEDIVQKVVVELSNEDMCCLLQYCLQSKGQPINMRIMSAVERVAEIMAIKQLEGQSFLHGDLEEGS